MKRNIWIIPMAVLLVFAAVITFVDIHIMYSETTQNKTVASSYPSRTGDFQHFSTNETGLFVANSNSMAAVLRPRLTKLIEGQPGTGKILSIQTVTDKLDFPVLYVEVLPVNTFWTPFYGKAEYQVSVSYASNGDISFRNQAAPHFKSDGVTNSIQFKAQYTLVDTSVGLISLKGYQNYLTEKMATLIRDDLLTILKG